MGVSGKTSLVSSVIAAVCIFLYIAAIALGAVRIISGIGDRRVLIEEECSDLTDRANSAAILGFMSQGYQESISDALNSSKTLLGIIISGSSGEYGFERQPGSVITWIGNSGRFKTGFGLPSEPYHRNLRIDGQRNATIRILYSYVDYDFFIITLKNTLLFILAGLAIAVLTLLIELAAKNRTSYYRAPSTAPWTDETEKEPPVAQGLYSPRGNVGWESYTHDRLEAELHRCASSEQDLSFIVMEYTAEEPDPAFYKAFADEAVSFFNLRDLIFEKGGQGLAVIIPGIDVDLGFARSEEFHSRISKKFPQYFANREDLCIGLSSRAGRLIEAKRIMFEASQALNKAMESKSSPIVAFKSDPEKYREFISKNHGQ
ncbi:hypothetical protein [Leadbettera azotonutricia]|uniref:Diguanylate cyclase (GGDEF) domain protein n=1 Tax=Leadbettera azotonutricia (strain ATCC BAA-888 / DSM 13862 / ZAS-9) TaxID=545695 RepID=F5YCW7_LEAAZ|nr:hypothetical protein [Leadbettera azotonutricia]AEF80871.1 diguanylate cyclase (GGDEF) domain protein [Leadbettera azotonutricia ZAS-9]